MVKGHKGAEQWREERKVNKMHQNLSDHIPMLNIVTGYPSFRMSSISVSVKYENTVLCFQNDMVQNDKSVKIYI